MTNYPTITDSAGNEYPTPYAAMIAIDALREENAELIKRAEAAEADNNRMRYLSDENGIISMNKVIRQYNQLMVLQDAYNDMSDKLYRAEAERDAEHDKYIYELGRMAKYQLKYPHDALKKATEELDAAVADIESFARHSLTCGNRKIDRDGSCINSSEGTCNSCPDWQWRADVQIEREDKNC